MFSYFYFPPYTLPPFLSYVSSLMRYAILVAQSEKGICAILIGDNSIPLLDDLRDRFSKAYILPGDAHLEKLAYKIVKFIENPKSIMDISLDIRGTDFQKKVWQLYRKFQLVRQ